MTITKNETNQSDFEKLDLISANYVKCKGCTKCCSEGLVYILPSEIPQMECLETPLIKINEITFIKRLEDGSCSMLDKKNKICRIYQNRPICCRLFPLDIFFRDCSAQWGIYSYCPRKRDAGLSAIKENNNEIDYTKLVFVSSRIEKILGDDRINHIIMGDQVCKKIEILDKLKDDYVLFKEISIPLTNEVLG